MWTSASRNIRMWSSATGFARNARKSCTARKTVSGTKTEIKQLFELLLLPFFS